MKKNLKSGLIIGLMMAALGTFPSMAAGWAYNNNGQQIYQNDDGSVVTNSWIKVIDNGNTIWYYATSTGALKRDGWQQIGGYYYYFDDSGVMQTGWVDDERYYCDENGVMKTGWRQVEAPESYIPDDDRTSETYWFYLNPSTGEKYRSNNSDIRVRNIDGVSYGFDEYGIMQTGWTATRNGGAEISDYMYFSDRTDTGFSYGQRVSSTWLSLVGPEDDDDDLSTGDVEWFYFKTDGYPAAGDGEYGEVVKVNGKRYLFNEKGNPLYGIQRDEEGNYYYCGTSKADSSVRTGKITVTEDDGDRWVCYFNSNGKGVTGVKDGLVYYKGKLQKADSENRYMVITASGTSIDGYVVDANGKLIKNKKNLKDKNGVKFTVDSSGNITYPDGGTLDTLNPEEELLEVTDNG